MNPQTFAYEMALMEPEYVIFEKGELQVETREEAIESLNLKASFFLFLNGHEQIQWRFVDDHMQTIDQTLAAEMIEAFENEAS